MGAGTTGSMSASEHDLRGRIRSATLRANVERGPATLGFALSHSRGRGSTVPTGPIETELSSIAPYAAIVHAEGVRLWAVVGKDEGKLRFDPGKGSPYGPTSRRPSARSAFVRNSQVRTRCSGPPQECGAHGDRDREAHRSRSDCLAWLPGQAHSLYGSPAAVSRLQGGHVSSPLPGIGVNFLPQRRHRRFRTRRSSLSKNRPCLVPAISAPLAPDYRAGARPARARRPPIELAVRRHGWDTGTASRAGCAAHLDRGTFRTSPCVLPRQPRKRGHRSSDAVMAGVGQAPHAGTIANVNAERIRNTRHRDQYYAETGCIPDHGATGHHPRASADFSNHARRAACASKRSAAAVSR